MDIEKAKELIRKRMQEEHEKEVEKYINNLDLRRLEDLKAKEITELTEEDLRFIGLRRVGSEEEENLYSFKGFDSGKIYFRRVPTGFEELGFQLRKKKDIMTTSELLDSAITKWRLKSDVDFDKTDYNFSDEPPF